MNKNSYDAAKANKNSEYGSVVRDITFRNDTYLLIKDVTEALTDDAPNMSDYNKCNRAIRMLNAFLICHAER